MSPYNKLDGGRYYDVGSQVSFEFDHVTQVRTYFNQEVDLFCIWVILKLTRVLTLAGSIWCRTLLSRIAKLRPHVR